jgi:hypothetical protein
LKAHGVTLVAASAERMVVRVDRLGRRRGEDRTEQTLTRFFTALGRRPPATIQVVCLDMWQAYLKALRTHAPKAQVLFERFHLMQRVSRAVDELRLMKCAVSAARRRPRSSEPGSSCSRTRATRGPRNGSVSPRWCAVESLRPFPYWRTLSLISRGSCWPLSSDTGSPHSVQEFSNRWPFESPGEPSGAYETTSCQLSFRRL